MSTLRATNIKHESSATNQIVLGADGSIGGTLGDTLAAKLDASAYTPGLELVTRQTLSAVSTVSVNNCFSSTYENYRIVVNLSGNSNQSMLQMRLRVSGSDNTSAAYYTQQNRGSDTTINGARTAGVTAFDISYSNTSFTSFDVCSPFATAYTMTVGGASLNGGTTTFQMWSIAGQYNATTSFDGFTLYPASGTLTGTLAVYGYATA